MLPTFPNPTLTLTLPLTLTQTLTLGQRVGNLCGRDRATGGDKVGAQAPREGAVPEDPGREREGAGVLSTQSHDLSGNT